SKEQNALVLSLSLSGTDQVNHGTRGRARVELCRLEDCKHADLPRGGSGVVHNVSVVSPCAGASGPCGYTVWMADLRSIQIAIQVLNPVGITSIGKVMCRRQGCILRVAHLDPFHTRTRRARTRLAPGVEGW